MRLTSCVQLLGGLRSLRSRRLGALARKLLLCQAQPILHISDIEQVDLVGGVLREVPGRPHRLAWRYMPKQLLAVDEVVLAKDVLERVLATVPRVRLVQR